MVVCIKVMLDEVTNSKIVWFLAGTPAYFSIRPVYNGVLMGQVTGSGYVSGFIEVQPMLVTCSHLSDAFSGKGPWRYPTLPALSELE